MKGKRVKKMSRREELLAVRHVDAGYGRINVLNDLTFSVRRGQVLGMIGPNGSGKTTVINVLTGIIHPLRGSILLRGKDISRLTPEARCRLGIGRTFQVPRPFERMTVFGNALTAAAYGSGRSRRENWETAEKALELTRLTGLRNTPSGQLMLLDRKRLEIARAVSTEPELLLLDEIAAGLTSAEVEEIMAMVAELKKRGYTIIWIEHIIETMMRATDELICLAEGRNILSGPPAEVLASEEVARLYLGKEEDDAAG